MCAWRCFDAVDTMSNMYAGLGHRAEARHRRHRYIPEEPRGRHVCELSRQLPEADGAGTGW